MIYCVKANIAVSAEFMGGSSVKELEIRYFVKILQLLAVSLSFEPPDV